MKLEFSSYPKAKRFFGDLATRGVKEVIELMEEYGEIKKTYGEFLAARYLNEVYKDFNQRWENLENGTKN